MNIRTHLRRFLIGLISIAFAVAGGTVLLGLVALLIRFRHGVVPVLFGLAVTYLLGYMFED